MLFEDVQKLFNRCTEEAFVFSHFRFPFDHISPFKTVRVSIKLQIESVHLAMFQHDSHSFALSIITQTKGVVADYQTVDP